MRGRSSRSHPLYPRLVEGKGWEWKKELRRHDRLPLGWYLGAAAAGAVFGAAVMGLVMMLVRRGGCP